MSLFADMQSCAAADTSLLSTDLVEATIYDTDLLVSINGG